MKNLSFEFENIFEKYGTIYFVPTVLYTSDQFMYQRQHTLSLAFFIWEASVVYRH